MAWIMLSNRGMENMKMKTGDRVQLQPAMSAWMQGDRFGEIVQVKGEDWVRVKLDKSRALRWFKVEDIFEVID